MLFGMIMQIFCGNMTGLVNSYELHVFFRCLSAICCCQMYTAGGMICKPNFGLLSLFYKNVDSTKIELLSFDFSFER